MTPDYDEILSATRIEAEDEIEINPSCLLVNGNVWGSLSNFSAVIGKPKSKKTFFIVLTLAAAMKKIAGPVEVVLKPRNNKVLYFDTEQSRPHVQRAVRRVGMIIGNYPRGLLMAYSLRKHTPAERLNIIDHAINTTKGVGLVIIDGLRDLVTGINDEEQATMITSKLLKWTDEKELHIVVVLHQNKIDNNARGHVGTEVINKAETVVSVNAIGEIAVVRPEYARDTAFEPFAFKINSEGLPVFIENFVNRKKVIGYSDIPRVQHIEVLEEVFKGLPNPKYRELTLAIQAEFTKRGAKMGENKIKSFLTEYMREGLVKKISEGNISTYKLDV